MAEITEEIFEGIYKKYYKMVFWRVNRKLGWTNAAEDVTQEIFMNIFSKYHLYRQDCALGTWIFQITTNMMNNHTRFIHMKKRDIDKEAFRHDYTREEGYVKNPKEVFIDNSISGDTVRQLSLEEKMALVHKAVESLDDNKKAVGRMLYLKHMSYSEITAELKCKPTYTRKMVHYVNSAIRHKLAVHQPYKEIMNEG